jgi:hypothetical protein
MARTNRSTPDLDRPRIEALIDTLIALLDTVDGDPDEDADDELDRDDDDDREEDDPDEDDDADEENGDDEPDLHVAPVYPSDPERSQDPDDWPGRWFGKQADVAMYRTRSVVPFRDDPRVIEFPRMPAR